MNSPVFSTRSSLAQGFAPFNYSVAKHAINFAFGLPDPAMFSELTWPDALSQNTGVATADLLQYTDAMGLPKLRTRLAERISKVAGPGLRVGWVLADSDVINRLARLKCDGGVSPIVSNIVLSLLQSRALDAHIVRLRQHYRGKRDSLHALLQRSRFCAPEYLLPSGGFSFWVWLASRIDAETFIEAARFEHDVHLVHGRHYGPRSGHHVRLCFSYLPMSLIEEVWRDWISCGQSCT
ncbi:aminotransferase class I/II-fold pyridoxal phosphate-dependent enzyme [Bradyrhizobium sp. DASA03120]|uniref:aminotransferase class I/II-fold pyridoxal phosphate-dependent enzyme n=1 Tax=Bradyrhizobium sp. SMVTL-02 TaxID=3395917 RepID=UPI003F70022C